jgi:hypothetical protein
MNLYRLLADFLVVIHCCYASFIVVGLALIVLGGWRKWHWVRNFWFRLLHFLMIAVVVEESFLGVVCPLTEWEDALREKAGETVEEGTFIGRIVHHLLFVDLSPAALTVCYCLFGLIILATFIFIPPRWPRWGKGGRRKGEGGIQKEEEKL